MSNQYQRDRQALERLQEELALRQVTAEIVVPDLDRPYPALNIYQPGRRYAVTSVWFYQQGDRLPGSRNAGRTTLISVYVWGHSFEHIDDAQQVEHTAERIAATYRAPAD
jgi:hypothetical protein